MSTLIVTSGGGPMECRLAVIHIRSRMQAEAENLDLSFSVSDDGDASPSVIVLVEGDGAMALVQSWLGTILWRQESALRPHHRRANWFVGVFLLPDLAPDPAQVPLAEVVFTSFRAGGPGGQYQNTTDSAVRASWRGLAAISRDERSQHRYKAKTYERLQHLVHAAKTERQRATAGVVHRQHRAMMRGDPVRSFTGPDFRE